MKTTPTHTPSPAPRFRTTKGFRLFTITVCIVIGALMLLGIGIEFFGPEKADGALLAMTIVCSVFLLPMWLAVWRPRQRALRILRQGRASRAKVMAFEQPFWSRCLGVLRTFLHAEHSAAGTAEVGYRVTLQLPGPPGDRPRLQAVVWRTWASALPPVGEIVEVIYDPSHEDRFFLENDLDRYGLERVA